jgi:hypothetical protein
VFFVTHQYVRNEGTFTWKERDCNFDGFSMPVLRVSPFKSLFIDLLL